MCKQCLGLIFKPKRIWILSFLLQNDSINGGNFKKTAKWLCLTCFLQRQDCHIYSYLFWDFGVYYLGLCVSLTLKKFGTLDLPFVCSYHYWYQVHILLNCYNVPRILCWGFTFYLLWCRKLNTDFELLLFIIITSVYMV